VVDEQCGQRQRDGQRQPTEPAAAGSAA